LSEASGNLLQRSPMNSRWQVSLIVESRNHVRSIDKKSVI
jgi:hypothetical protein